MPFLLDNQENYKKNSYGGENYNSNNSAFLQFYSFITQNSSFFNNSAANYSLQVETINRSEVNFDTTTKLTTINISSSTGQYSANTTRENFEYFYRVYVCNYCSKLIELIQLIFLDLFTFVINFWSETTQDQFSFEYRIFLYLLLIFFTLLGLIFLFLYIFKEKLDELNKFQG